MGKKKKVYSRKGGYARMWHEVFDSPAYRNLSLPARALLTEFMHIYRPDRNGQLSISTRNATKRLHCAENTATKAFNSLVEHGLIALTKGHYWQERKAREWRLTFEACNGHEPTDEWKLWTLEKPIPSNQKKNPDLKPVGNLPQNIGQRM